MKPDATTGYISSLRDAAAVRRRGGAVGLVVLLSLVLIGCGEPEPNADLVTDHYESRGEIATLPEEGNPASSLQVRHEAVPEFRDGSGAVVGMDAMQMPFPVGDDVDLEGLAVGDKVAFTFTFTRDAKAGLFRSNAFTGYEKLPADTELDLASPPAVDSTDPHAGHDHAGHDHLHHDH